MATEKKFFQVRIASKCTVPAKMVNGLMLTKKWQVKVGSIGDFAKFPDVEAQVVVKQGNKFVPVEEAPSEASEGEDTHQPNSGAGDQTEGNVEANTGDSGEGPGEAPNFADMTVEQLKNFLIAKGVASSELRNATKPELMERAQFIWSQNS
jgi:hypothetical protein